MSPARTPAPWVRTRLRTAPGGAAALALLVLVTVFLAAALPRAVDRYEDSGLRRALAQAGAARTSFTVTAPPPASDAEHALGPGKLAQQFAAVLKAAQAPFVPDRAQSAYGVTNRQELEAAETWLPRPSGLPAQIRLFAQSGLAEHGRLAEGRLPNALSPNGELEGAVSTETANTLHLKAGSLIHVDGTAVRITGVATPRTPSGGWWDTEPLLHTPALVQLPGDPLEALKYWRAAVMLAPESAPALLGTSGAPTRYWQLAPDPTALHAHELTALLSSVARLESGPGLAEIRTATDQQASAATELDETLARYARLRAGISPLVAVAAAGTGTVAAIVLAMAGGLAADRRRAELSLLRARGASLRGMTARLAMETAAVVVPAAALGFTAALVALPDARLSPALWTSLATTTFACLALPLRAALIHRRVTVHAAREDVVSVRPSRRRTVMELTLVVLAGAAVEGVRRQGAGDELAALAPVLTGTMAALLLIRLYPYPLRALARPLGRLRGLIVPLSLARAARTPVSSALPLLALLTALTTAAFGGSVLAGVEAARDRAALLAVGADARLESLAALPAGSAEQVGKVPGVRSVSPVALSYNTNPHDGPAYLPLAGVDPTSYAELARATSQGGFPEGALRSNAGAVPALASPKVTRAYGHSPFPLRLESGALITVRITLTRAHTPAVPGDEFLVVDRTALPGAAARPTVLLVTGAAIDATALRKTAPPGTTPVLRKAERATYVDSPLQSGAESVYSWAVAAATVYTVLALLLSLLRTSPERTALLARLRTMGLTRREARRLLLLESLPQTALAALGGTLTGWTATWLLSPGIDLTTLALPPTVTPPDGLRLTLDLWSSAIPAAGVLVIGLGVAGVQAWWAGRAGSVRELRAGEAR